MEEWKSPYNAFNSMGVLMYPDHLEGIAKQDFLPPMMADIDPSNACNYNCVFCNALSYRNEVESIMTKEHLIKIADFCKEWGIKSACVAGGGEPLTNPHFNVLLNRLHFNGIEIGVITNGSLLTDKHIETISRTCRWCGFSMDAGKASTYAAIKGIKNERLFQKVLTNIEKLVKKCKEIKSKCEVSYKYLLHPLNEKEILLAAEIAKKIGVKDFHLRPVGWDNHEIVNGEEPLKFDLPLINKQITLAQESETKDFRFFGVRHKFNPDFSKKVPFKRCWALPLLVTFGADGNYHSCFDMRGNKDLISVSHYPEPRKILEYWNTDKHKNQLKNIDVNKCPRCTFIQYNQIIEEVFIKDNMCRRFI